MRDAVRTLRLLPDTGCLPQGFKSAMPTPVRGREEYFDQDTGYGSKVAKRKAAQGRRNRSVSREAIARLEYALTLMLGVKLTKELRQMVWGRAEGVPWKTMEERTGVRSRTLQRWYSLALVELCAYAIALKRKPVSQKSMTQFRRFAS